MTHILTADQFGDFTYIDTGTTITITGYPTNAVGAVEIPATIVGKPVTSIDNDAFAACLELTSVTIPSGVTRIDWEAFADCYGLESMYFLGDVPAEVGSNLFNDTNSLTVYCFDEATGFTSPTWQGRPVVRMGPSSPVKEWMADHGLPYDTDPHQDLNGDGVNLLLAYTLDLDPHDARSGLPRAMMGPDTLGMKFHAAAPGITYTVQTSEDMKTWGTDGVTLSELDPDGYRTATVSRDSPRRFMRLVVNE
ncbi:MAG: leucine-rich repeat domain-containing protein [Akkermansiaceae bacterium]|nr:leucine-rich repeat domain-containing protein [Akkermansiaceae bacterium]